MIFSQCSRKACCDLRTTCRALKEHADPIVFQYLRLCSHKSERVNGRQIFSLATRSSNACEYTMHVELGHISSPIRPVKSTLTHFGICCDLRVHLPTAISMLRNLRSFRSVTISISFTEAQLCVISWGGPYNRVVQYAQNDDPPNWLVNALAQAVARLPRLIEVRLRGSFSLITPFKFPLGLFSNLTTLHVAHNDNFTFSQMAIAIANSPQLRVLEWISRGCLTLDPPTLSALFSNLSAENPLHLDRLYVRNGDVTLDRVILPHLTRLTSIKVYCTSERLAQNMWSSFRANPIKVPNVEISGFVTEDTMQYLSSFSGLKQLHIYFGVDIVEDEGLRRIREMLLEEVLQKHVNALESLTVVDHFCPWVTLPYFSFCILLFTDFLLLAGSESC
jgi:hypothetical protein